MKSILLFALLLSALVSAEGQESVSTAGRADKFDATISSAQENSPGTKPQSLVVDAGARSKRDVNDFRVLPAYQPKPNRFLAAIKRHPLWDGIIVGVGTAVLIDAEQRKGCDYKKYGGSGSGVNCPKYSTWPK